MTSGILTPKEFSVAIGVSESTLRRWVDAGAIATFRTTGGHRRIPLAEALRFIRESGANVAHPEVLGIASNDVNLRESQAVERFYKCLYDADMSQCASVLISLFVSGQPVASICDGPMRGALARVGELWKTDPLGILREHRATEFCTRIIYLLRQCVSNPPDDAPVAIGGAPKGDPYVLPSLMSDLVLTEAGFRTINYGPDTPVGLLADAANAEGASIVWASISIAPQQPVRDELSRLADDLRDNGRTLVVGGQGTRDLQLASTVLVGSMTELAGAAKGLVSRR